MAISLKCLRSLNLIHPSQRGRAAHIAAASGLVQREQSFFVIADDELSLGVFPATSTGPGCLVTLGESKLPLDPIERKALKPDYEVLLEWREGLLALPSGSKANRTTGAHWTRDRGQWSCRPLDLSDLYARIQIDIPELNLEGAVVRDDELILFQRGNGPSRQNSIVHINLKTFDDSVPSVSSKAFKSIKNVELGEYRGVPLSFTDAALGIGGHIYFLAAAEATDSTYLDGEFVGAKFGCLNIHNEVIWCEDLTCPAKPEGLAIDPDHKHFYVVTDADDECRPAKLYQGLLPELDSHAKKCLPK